MIDALPLLLAPEGYQISRSVRLRSPASAYLARTNGTSGTDPLKFTVSAWVKRGLTESVVLGSNTGTNAFTFMGFWTGDVLAFRIRNSSAVDLVRLESTAVFRDYSAWYHVVAVYDSANAVSTERVKLYVNGVRITAFTTATYPSLNQGTTGTFATNPQIGRTNTNSTNMNYCDEYLAEMYFIDGQALTPSSFGEFDYFTGVWQPKKYTGTYGTNGFYLNFSDNSAATAAAIGKDFSGNGNNFTPNAISVAAGVTYDSMLDVPTMWADGGNGRGNYAVLNPLSSNALMTLAGGNLNVTSNSASQSFNAYSSVAVLTGKYYVEATINTGSVADMIGVCPSTLNAASARFDELAGGVGYYMNGNKYVAGVSSAYGASYTTGDVIGIALDMDAQTVAFYKNGVSQGTISSSLTANTPYYIVTGDAAGTAGINQSFNFGQRPFTYTPPSGFKALNTQNLPDSLVKKGNQYFDATLYTGNGTSQNVTNAAGFQPDFVWFKSRNAAAGHVVFDSVRGANQGIYPNATNAEGTWSGQSFLANGFTVNATFSGEDNTNGNTYVGWQWKKGATQGFDIVTYTGTGVARTISHGLGVKPSMIIIKNRSGVYDWPTWHQFLPNPTTQHFWLNATNAAQTSGSFNSTQPTSSVFSVGTTGEANANGNNFVAYLFSEVPGFSKFGSYTGNGSADGPFVFCGFRPRFVLLKNSSNATGYDWIIWDTERGVNVLGPALYPNLSSAESSPSSNSIDILSNGFKLRNTGAASNASANTYIFAAFAENPFKNALAR